MSLTIDKPYSGLRAATDGDNLVFLPREGVCDGVVLNTPYVGLRAASDNGDLVFVLSDQNVNDDGTLILNKPYIGLLAAESDGSKVFVVDGMACCFCPSVTSYGPGTPNSPSTGPVMWCRITSSAFATPKMSPLVFSAGVPPLYAPQSQVSAGTIYIPSGCSSLPYAYTDPHADGWWEAPSVFPHPLSDSCSTFHLNILMVEVRRCDMSVFVTQIRRDSSNVPGGGPVIYTVKAFHQCNDPGDIIQCSPFYVKRKMDFVTAHNVNPSYYVNEPLTDCSGATGSDCSGAEYIELFLTEPGDWNADWDADWNGDWFGDF